MPDEVNCWTLTRVMTLSALIVAPSVPVRVIVLLEVNVLPLAIVNVALVAGAVTATLLMEVADATPSIGVTNVGVFANTAAPLPVSSVNADAKLADDGVARNVAIPAPNPVIPPTGNPVPLVNVTELGVPITRPLGNVVDHDATPPALVTATEFVGGLTNSGTDIVPLLIVIVELSGCTRPRCTEVAV